MSDQPGCPRSRVPVNTALIEYAGAQSKPALSAPVQFVLGLAFAFAYGTLTFAAASRAGLLFWVNLLVLIAVPLFLGTRFKWSAFVAGFLAAVLVAPVAFGIWFAGVAVSSLEIKCGGFGGAH